MGTINDLINWLRPWFEEIKMLETIKDYANQEIINKLKLICNFFSKNNQIHYS